MTISHENTLQHRVSCLMTPKKLTSVLCGQRCMTWLTSEYSLNNLRISWITSPTLAKEHIATYYESLYQARDGEDSHAHWTEHINRRVAEVDKDKSEVKIEEINLEEINKCISKLGRNVSTWPDGIPNEALIEANQETRELIRKSMNNICNEEKIPDDWQSGEVIILCKGKGEEGKCSNERRITPASNAGKLFERIINNRITPKIKFTEAQGGGQKGKSAADHILILSSIIKQHKQQRKHKISSHRIPGCHQSVWQGMANSKLKTKNTNQIRHDKEAVEYANLIDEIAKRSNMKIPGKKHYQRHRTDRVSPMDGWHCSDTP